MEENVKYIILLFILLQNTTSFSQKRNILKISCDTFDYSKSMSKQFNISKNQSGVISTIYLENFNDNTLPFTISEFPNLKELHISSPSIYDLKGISDFKNLQYLDLQYIKNEKPFQVFNISDIWSLKNINKLNISVPIIDDIVDSIINFKNLEDLTLNINQPVWGILTKMRFVKKINLPEIDQRYSNDKDSEFILLFDALFCNSILKLRNKKISDGYNQRIVDLENNLRRIYKNCNIKNLNGKFSYNKDNIVIEGMLKNGLPDSIWIYKNGVYSGTRKYLNGSSCNSKVEVYSFNNKTIDFCEERKNLSPFILNRKTYFDLIQNQISDDYFYIYKYDKLNDKGYLKYMHNVLSFSKLVLDKESACQDEWIIDFKKHICYKYSKNQILYFNYMGTSIKCSKIINDCFSFIKTDLDNYCNKTIQEILFPFFDSYQRIEKHTVCEECLKQVDESINNDEQEVINELNKIINQSKIRNYE